MADGLKEVGSRLVAKGSQQYIRDMMQANKAHQGVGDSAKKAAGGLGALNAKSAAVAVTAGNLLTNALQKAGQALVGMATGALDAVSTYEKMEQSMTSLVAKEVKTTQGIEDMGKALEMAAPRAEELLGWIQDLAIKSPFDQQGVAMAFKTALAYGFTTQEAQRLTSATIDFTTATGATSDTMGRVALALGQVKARGKLMGGEMLQLVEAGFNVNEMLKEMGYTSDDVSKGMVSAGEFIEKFTQKMESDFGGAAERSAETVGGLLNSLDDLQEMGLRAAFGPIIQAMLPYVSALTDKFQKALPYVQLFGEALAKGFTFIIENRGTIAAIAGIIGGMGGAFMLVAKWQTVATAVQAAWAAVTGVATVATTGLAGAVTFLLSPLGLLAAGVAVLVGAFALIGIGVKKARDKQAENLQRMQTDFQSHSQVQASIQDGLEQRRLDSMGEMGDKMRQMQAQQGAQQGEESRSWGENLVIQFAQGMANAISAVIEVLNQLGQAIANWLSPGSPPKLLPEIDKWGQSAMGEFTKGMGQADMSPILKVGGQIGKTLDPLMKTWGTKSMSKFIGGMSSADFGMIDEVSGALGDWFSSKGKEPGLNKTAKMKGGAAGLVKEQKATGSISDASFDKYFASIKMGNKDMQNYVKTLFQVRGAQDKLNQVTEKYSAMMAPLNEEMNQIQKRRQQVVDSQRKEELKDIIERAKANGDTLAVELAQMELREMAIKDEMTTIEEKKVAEETAAQTEYDAAQEKLAIQQAVIDAQMEANRVLAEADMGKLKDELGGASSAAAGLKGGMKGAAGAAAEMASSLAGAGAGIGEGLSNPINTAIDGIKERFGGLVEDLKAPFAGIGDQVVGLGETWLETYEAIKLKIEDFIVKVGEMKTTWENNVELMKTAWRLLKERITEYVNRMKDKWQETSDKIRTTREEWADAFQQMREAGERLKDKIKEYADKIKEDIISVKDKAREAFQKIIDKVEEVKTAFWGMHDAMLRIIDKVETFIERIAEAAGIPMPGGYAMGGFTGMMSSGRVAGVVHGKELVVPTHVLRRGADAVRSYAKAMVPTSVMPQKRPSGVMMPAPVQQVTNNTTNVYHQNQIQGVGEARMEPTDMRAFETMVRRILIETLRET